MAKYRIVTNGYIYKIQYNFLFFWFNIDGSYPQYFENLTSAQKRLEEFESFDKKYNGNWMPL